ncbi:CHAD domain-containing protein [Synechococcus sp. RedBA-s]|nr:CHAD domain-containing protein [Synechococcus sp. RedBA-s]
MKGVRYRLEHLEPFAGAGLRDWVTDLRTAQDHLGDLHDLQVLAEYVGHQLDGELARELPGLHGALEAAMHQRWNDW